MLLGSVHRGLWVCDRGALETMVDGIKYVSQRERLLRLLPRSLGTKEVARTATGTGTDYVAHTSTMSCPKNE